MSIPGINLKKAEYKEITKAGIMNLVFDKPRNTKNTSWLQKLFLQKCKEVFPNLLDSDLQPTFKLEEVNLGENVYGVIADDKVCKTIMTDYKDTLIHYTGNKCLFDDIPICKADRDSITWGVQNQRRLPAEWGISSTTSYPANTELNKKRWRDYTDTPKWLDKFGSDINMNHNLYWRNILVPAHEITHSYAISNYKFKMAHDGRCIDAGEDVQGSPIDHIMSTEDVEKRNGFFKTEEESVIDEWTASVCNANVFILNMKTYFDYADKNNKSIYQLHTIHGVLYIVRMLYTLTYAIDKLTDEMKSISGLALMEKAKRWTKMELTQEELTKDNVADLVKILGGHYETKWANTYFKHISALMFAINFFTDSPDFINDIYSADIWYGTKLNDYKKQVIEENEWSALQAPREVSRWIIE